MSLLNSSLLAKYLQCCTNIQRPADMTVSELIKLSDQFQHKFPVGATRCDALLLQDATRESTLTENINNTYPLIHETVLPLMCEFLDHKKQYGTEVEKALYSDMGLERLVERLLVKRPLVFITACDCYTLREPSSKSGAGGWETIGLNDEKAPLVLQNYMSYDEIKLASLMCVSSPSFFINDGRRRNRGMFAKPGTFEESGIIVGVVGTRFERNQVMEWQDMVISKVQNVPENGYGPVISCEKKLNRIWAKFYGRPYLTLFTDMCDSKPAEVVEIFKDTYFHTGIYKQRIQTTAETLLLEANHRAAQVNKKAYVHVVGFGLGVWELCSDIQQTIFMDAFASSFQVLTLDHISDVDFSWFSEKVKMCGTAKDGKIFPGTKIMIHFSYRNPYNKLEGIHEGKLIVSSFAWDGNAFPGNEYWNGNLSASGDPAAACCSQISELQNPYINRKVAGSNLHVASRKHGLLPLDEYAKLMAGELRDKK